MGPLFVYIFISELAIKTQQQNKTETIQEPRITDSMLKVLTSSTKVVPVTSVVKIRHMYTT